MIEILKAQDHLHPTENLLFFVFMPSTSDYISAAMVDDSSPSARAPSKSQALSYTSMARRGYVLCTLDKAPSFGYNPFTPQTADIQIIPIIHLIRIDDLDVSVQGRYTPDLHDLRRPCCRVGAVYPAWSRTFFLCRICTIQILRNL